MGRRYNCVSIISVAAKGVMRSNHSPRTLHGSNAFKHHLALSFSYGFSLCPRLLCFEECALPLCFNRCLSNDSYFGSKSSKFDKNGKNFKPSFSFFFLETEEKEKNVETTFLVKKNLFHSIWKGYIKLKPK